MLLNIPGEKYLYNGITYEIGQKVIAAETSDYKGLNGVITEIRSGEDKETDNEGVDIYCSFEAPIHPSDKLELEKRFTALYQMPKTVDDIVLDLVIMPAADLIVNNSSDNYIKVYVVEEKMAESYEIYFSSKVIDSLVEARAYMNARIKFFLSDEGMIKGLEDEKECVTETTENTYERYIDGNYARCHYAISIEEKELKISPINSGILGRKYCDECKREDFISQVEQWEKVGKLTESNYVKFISDKRIPDEIDDNLGDDYWESYWETVSVVASNLLDEYLVKQKEGNL